MQYKIKDTLNCEGNIKKEGVVTNEDRKIVFKASKTIDKLYYTIACMGCIHYLHRN